MSIRQLGPDREVADRQSAEEHLPGVVIIGTLCDMEAYYANESTVGRVRSGEIPFAIGVVCPCDDSIPSGIAFEIGKTADSLALWRLKVHGEHVPGRFIIVDGLFVLVEPAKRGDDENGVCQMDVQQSVARMR